MSKRVTKVQAALQVIKDPRFDLYAKANDANVKLISERVLAESDKLSQVDGLVTEANKSIGRLSNSTDYNHQELKKLNRSLFNTRILTGVFILLNTFTLAVLTNKPSLVFGGVLASLIFYMASAEKF